MAKLTLTDLSSLTNEQSSISVLNANAALIETALENTLSRDGTSPNTMSADFDMDSNRILNLPDAVLDQEPVTLSQFEAGVSSSGAAPSTVQYVVMAATDGLSAERVLTGTSNEITVTDGGAGSAVTLSLPSSLTFTGKTVTGGTFSNSALSGTTSLASGHIFNWNSSDVTLTHSANTLTFAGASSGYVFDAVLSGTSASLSSTSPLTFTGGSSTISVNSGSGNNSLTIKTRASGSVNFQNESSETLYQLSPNAASGIQNYIQFVANTSTNAPYFATQGTVDANVGLNIGMKGTSPTLGIYDNGISNQILTLSRTQLRLLPTTAATTTTDGALRIDGGISTAGALVVGSTGKFTSTLSPFASDGAALGSTSLMWSDLFLASGAVVNFNNGDVTLTHSSDTLTLGGGNLAFGTNYFLIGERSAPSAPATDTLAVYAKDVAGVSHLFTQNSSGTETDLNAGASNAGSWVLLQSINTTSTTDWQFETGLDDTYDQYVIVISDLSCTTDDSTLYVQVKQSGSYQTSGYLGYNYSFNTSGSSLATGAVTAGIPLCGINGNELGNAANERLCAQIWFSNPDSSHFHPIQGQSAWDCANDVGGCGNFWGRYNTAGVITGVRVNCSSNITGGRGCLYGIKKA